MITTTELIKLIWYTLNDYNRLGPLIVRILFTNGKSYLQSRLHLCTLFRNSAFNVHRTSCLPTHLSRHFRNRFIFLVKPNMEQQNKGNGPNDDLERKALKRKSRFFVCGWIGSATSHDIFYNPNSWKLLDLSIGPITITNNIHLVYWSCLPKYCVFHHLKEYKFSSRPIQHSPQFWSIEIPYWWREYK